MSEHIHPEVIAKEILAETDFQGTFLIVEGKSDELIFRKFIDPQTCQIKVAAGSQPVIETVQLLEKQEYQRVLGIIDADFRHLEGQVTDSPNILLTDYHDIEMMIIHSPALEYILENYSDKEKYSHYLDTHKLTLRELFIERAVPIGLLKWINIEKQYGLRFKPEHKGKKELDYKDFIDSRTLEYLGHNALIDTVKAYSDDLPVPDMVLISDLTHFEDYKVDKWQLCNGHDVCHIIALALLKFIGNHNTAEISFYQIEKELHLAYDSTYFQETQLFTGIRTWEKNHVGQKVLNSKMFRL